MVEVQNRSNKKKGQIDHPPRGPAGVGPRPCQSPSAKFEWSIYPFFFVRSVLDLHHLYSCTYKSKKINKKSFLKITFFSFFLINGGA